MKSQNRGRKAKPSGALFPEEASAETGVNREPAAPVMFCLDGTTSLRRMKEVYVVAIKGLFDGCRNHPHARTAAHVSVGVGGREFTPTPFRPFAEAELPEFELRSGSPGAMWLSECVRHLRAKRQQMQDDAVMLTKAILVFIGDFHFDDGEGAFNAAVEEYRTFENECPQFNGFMVLAGSHPNVELATRVSKKRAPVRLDELKVDQLFDWMRSVIESVSMSQPGQSIELPTPTWTLTDGDR